LIIVKKVIIELILKQYDNFNNKILSDWNLRKKIQRQKYNTANFYLYLSLSLKIRYLNFKSIYIYLLNLTVNN
jgi:hypothetical protein